jgi:hypothetical protein
MTLDNKCDTFHQLLDFAVSTIPVEYITLGPKDKPWITPLIKSLINKRYEAFRNKRFQLYEHYKTKVKKEIEKSKGRWISAEVEKPSGIWSIVKDCTNKKKNDNISQLLNRYNSPAEAAEAFNCHFTQIFSKHSITDQTNFSNLNVAWKVDTTVLKVFDLLNRLKTSKSPGSDISPKLLKLASPILAEPVAHLFSLSVSQLILPKRWKLADVVPVPKKTNPTIKDLRPISKLPILSKLLEKLVLESVRPQLLEKYGKINLVSAQTPQQFMLTFLSSNLSLLSLMILPSLTFSSYPSTCQRLSTGYLIPLYYPRYKTAICLVNSSLGVRAT